MSKKFNVDHFRNYWVVFEDNYNEDIIAKEAGFNSVPDYYQYVNNQDYSSKFEKEEEGIYFRCEEECRDLADRLNKRVNNDFPFEEGDVVKSKINNKRFKVIKIMAERDVYEDNIFLQHIGDGKCYVVSNSDDYVKVKPKEELDQGDEFKIGAVKYEVICRDDTEGDTLYFVKESKTGSRGLIESGRIHEVL